MIAQEKEARKKRCCDGGGEITYCIAAECMAWVWLAGQDDGQESNAGFCGLVYKVVLEEI